MGLKDAQIRPWTRGACSECGDTIFLTRSVPEPRSYRDSAVCDTCQASLGAKDLHTLGAEDLHTENEVIKVLMEAKLFQGSAQEILQPMSTVDLAQALVEAYNELDAQQADIEMLRALIEPYGHTLESIQSVLSTVLCQLPKREES